MLLLILQKVFPELEQIQSELKPISDQVDTLLLKQPAQHFGSFTSNLLARMSGKLVQIYAKDITELIIDDLLHEMVFILNHTDSIKEQKFNQVK